MTVLEQQVSSDTVIVSAEAGESPFAGMTLEQAQLLNSALGGLPVKLSGGRDQGASNVYIFRRMVLPGDWCSTPFEIVGDLMLTRAELVDEHWVPIDGIGRVISAALVRQFDALSLSVPYRYCSQCGAPVPRTGKIFDLGGLSNRLLPSGEFEWEQRFECAKCW